MVGQWQVYGRPGLTECMYVVYGAAYLQISQGVSMGTQTTAKGQMSIVIGLQSIEGCFLELWEEGTPAEAVRCFGEDFAATCHPC